MSPKPLANKPHHGSDSPTTSATPESEVAVSQQKSERGVTIPRTLSVKQLAKLLEFSPVAVIKNLMKNGVMASINQVIDYDTAAIVASDFGYEAHEEPSITREAVIPPGESDGYLRFPEEDPGSQELRPPVVTIMGHVDHGKTTLLDAIRQSNIIASEVGDITQHIGAYQVEVQGQKITFLDTPGHEAFTAMRARGAQVTDIAVLVIAADDGIMPQTVEAINHARAANVSIVVAINKIDKPDADLEKVKRQLSENALLIEEWGGDIICVPISAKIKQGISELLENILIVAELAELRANPDRRAIGTVIEAKLDNTKGPLATALIQTGTLKVGNRVVVGETWGRVKAMFDDRGNRVKKATPATPVKVLGLNSVPQVGDRLTVVAAEREARVLAQKHQEEKQGELRQPTRVISLHDLSTQIQSGRVKELNIILKTDVQGSIEPVKNSLEQLKTDQVGIKIIHSGSGNITESDVMLAIASQGIIVGFNTQPELGARRLAEVEGVDIRCYEVIYDLVGSIEKALRGMLEPTYVDVIEGHAEVRAIFSASKWGKVAGGYVIDGKITRGALARVLRGGQLVHESNVSSLRHFKDDVPEMSAGFECGVGIEGYTDFQIGDIIEVYRKEKSTRG